MRKLYIVPKDVWLANVGTFSPQIGSHYIDLVNSTAERTSQADILDAWSKGSDIDANMILLSTAFHHEVNEDLWEDLDAVAILPHPTFEGNIKLKDVIVDSPNGAIQAANNGGQHPHAGKKVKQKHVDALKKLSLLGFDENDTVLQLAKKAAACSPQVKLRGLR